MPSGIFIGRIAGVAIHLDWSLLVIFMLISFALANGVFPAWHPEWTRMLNWLTALGASVLFLASVLLHELSHALVGRLQGIPIRRITLFMFGGMAHLEKEPGTAWGELVMALAGPATSLVLGMIFLTLAGWLAGPIEVDPEQPQTALATLGPLATLLLWLGPVNLVLGIFNLVPAFPLDGGRVLRAIVWMVTGNLRAATRWASRLGQLFAWWLMAMGILMIFGLRVPILGGGLIGGLWITFIGWFLNNAAVMGYRQLVVQESLEGVPVSRLMQTRLTRIPPDMSVRELAYEHLMTSGQRAFPIEDSGRFLGLVTLRDMQRCPPERWDATPVADIMTAADQLASVSPGDDVLDVLGILGKREVNQLPVLDRGRLVGLIRREDLIKWMSLPAHGGEQADASRLFGGVHR